MKVALLADIHGNALALYAVLKAARINKVDKLLIAGDFVGYYYHPDQVLELLDDWKWEAVSGNHEVMLAQWINGINQAEILKKYGSGIKKANQLLTSNQIELLTNLPSKCKSQIDNYSVLLCHGSPWDQDCYVYPDSTEQVHQQFFKDKHDLVVYGHTHYPVIWEQNNQYVVNPGSVGQPRNRKPGASWALWDTVQHKITLMHEKYDNTELVKECLHNDPQLPYLSNVLTRQ